MAIHVVVSGHIGRDAETRPAGSTNVVSFSLASSAFRKKEKQTDWLNISMFGSRAEALCKYLTKGAPVTVRGELHVREYDKDGAKRFSIEVKADDIELMGSKTREGGASGGGGSTRQQSKPKEAAPSADFGGAGTDDSDIPFVSCDVSRASERWWRWAR